MSLESNTVAVLLSSYNGASYIREQLDSLLSQKFDGSIDIHIRDDGSKDCTMDILDEYKEKYPNTFYIYTGENLGPANSFLKLLEDVEGYDYYAFCDQDDFWMENKLSIAYKYLSQNTHMPNLYSSSLNIVDSKLKFIKKSSILPQFELGNVLVETSVAGCTMVLNDRLRTEVLKTLPTVKQYRILMHDAWVLKIAMLKGEAFFDETSYIKYRQHDSNVIGVSTSLHSMFKSRVKNIKRSYKVHSMVDEALLLQLIYNGKLDKDKMDLIQSAINLDGSLAIRVKELLKRKVYRRRLPNKVLFYMMVLLRLYKKHIIIQ